MQTLHDMNLQYTMPRWDDQTNDTTRRRAIDTEKAKATLPLVIQRQRLEIERVRTQHKLLEERLKRMTADRQFLTTKATTDGILYYGKIFKGRTSDSTSLSEMLRHHNGVPTSQVIMTVVQPRPLCIRTSVPENQLSDLRPGVQGTATAVAFPDIELPVTLDTRRRRSDLAGQLRGAGDGGDQEQAEALDARHELQDEDGLLSEA